MKRVLIIWEEIPDNSSFVIREVDSVELASLLKWHDTYINGDNDDPAMNDYFYDHKGYFKFQKIEDYLQDVHYDYIVRMGFIL